MSTPLRRRLGLGDATVIGVASMVGAGVFVAFAPAAAAAGAWLLLGLAIAVAVAYANATATAQLAAAHPTSGGAYAYGRAELGPWWGFAAGWSFVIGKLASCAAMALTFAAYAAPDGWERVVAATAIVALVVVNVLGVTRTAQVSRVLVVIVLAGIAVAVACGWFGVQGGAHTADFGWSVEPTALGVLQSGGLLFFALAGYARIATMGEEVLTPSRTIPRAIIGAFTVAVLLYTVVAVTLLVVLGPAELATSAAPLADLAARSGAEWARPVVAIAAAAGSLGALLALIAGIGRTSLAMAREGDLPRALAAVHPRFGTPHRAEILIGVILVAVVLIADVRGAIAFSSFGVLLYYAIANLAALRQRAAARRTPRWLQVFGLIGCVVLAVTVPWQGAVIGVVILAIGFAARAIALSRAA